VWYGGTVMPSGNPMTVPPAPGAQPKLDAPRQNEANSARLIIDAPADATLFIDDKQVGNENRQFTTPALAPGKTFYYTVRVEMNRDGKPVTESRKVFVRANETTTETFGTTATAVAMETR
jgi:uncharacterized protein (TIGR03000 family)